MERLIFTDTVLQGPSGLFTQSYPDRFLNQRTLGTTSEVDEGHISRVSFPHTSRVTVKDSEVVVQHSHPDFSKAMRIFFDAISGSNFELAGEYIQNVRHCITNLSINSYEDFELGSCIEHDVDLLQRMEDVYCEALKNSMSHH